MSKTMRSRFPFESKGNLVWRNFRTLGGLIIVASFIIFMSLYIYQNPIQTATYETIKNHPFYLSAGSLLCINPDGEQSLKLGETLQPGSYYRATKSSLLRSSKPGVNMNVETGCRIAVQDDYHGDYIELIEGYFELESRRSLGSQYFAIHQTKLQILPNSAITISLDEQIQQVNIYEGKIILLADSDILYSAGTQLNISGSKISETIFDCLESPVIKKPENGTVIRRSMGIRTETLLEWEPIEEATKYRLELSSAVTFTDPRAVPNISASSIQLTNLANGNYYWRVFAENPEKVTSFASQPGNFSIEPQISSVEEMVSAPELENLSASVQSSLISLRGKVEPGARVRVHLERYGDILTEPREIIVSSSGEFNIQLNSPVKGEINVIVEAFYRPEVIMTKGIRVIVDF